MTAVASPPSVQTGPRLGWYDPGNGGQDPLSSMNPEEVSRMFIPRKTLHRSNSSSSIGSNSSTSSTSTVLQNPSGTDAGQPSNTESTSWSSKKKASKSVWPNSKSEPVSGISNPRSQAKPAFFSGTGASSAMSGIQQPSSILPSQQHLLQSSLQNGARSGNTPTGEPPAILTLIPINGTFEKKQITVPFYPETLRIGRQTNAKTVPTPKNGFFDSKVLSRQHAEIWADRSGKIWIRDVKSSNGTFLNGQRLSPENRESDPHEIRENDTLELGIDIVSEDQKTIVHHKVSAKVEHAGIYGSMPNIFDLTLGDLDPASGNGLLPSPLSQPLSHIRGRAGSASSTRSTQSTASSQFNQLQQQRQMNYWSSPLSIEQIVRRLTTEMKQAKQQQQDLRQTDEFLAGLMKPGAVEKEKQKHSPGDSTSSRQLNGRPKMPRMDSFSRFSDPPAPPPQQPLPEKPDSLPRNGVDAISPLKRSDTEKPKMTAGSSPVSRESSQILSLIEALSSAKRELDSQGARVKELESMLVRERQARESAEEKAKALELLSTKEAEGASESSTVKPQSDGSQLNPEETKIEKSIPEISDGSTASQQEPILADSHSEGLQRRLETLMDEMEQMRKQVSLFKDRTEKAETETVEVRKSLSEMIETLRKERIDSRKRSAPISSVPETASTNNTSSQPDNESAAAGKDSKPYPQHSVLSPHSNEVESPAHGITAQSHRPLDVIEQSSPYASMLGVVLLGVGLMAYLNGWQRVDK
ncbi:putative cytoplasm to vacuole targeting Vps64 [Aspergillus lucknowensis]|uniref:Cytoplasm to vacuole targeting Vps64 n=1 Tax=Aspergillus lucknowensis TaxID=176173 RepID=A0ABR4LVL3_9EURO